MSRDLRPIILVIGVLLTGLGLAMLPSVLIDLYDDAPEWQAFLMCSVLTVFTGALLTMVARGPVRSLTLRGAFLLTNLTWVALVVFAAFPFMLSTPNLSFTDAIFESMSGLTTTGSTVIVGLDVMPRGVLMWRSILQWIGGIGIIVTAIAVLPILKVGGMQLFRMESSDTSEKLLPRATQIAASIAGIYLFLSVACASVYAILGLSWFDAIAHAMTTVATGGFSTRDASMAAFVPQGADIAATVFMILAALPFGLYILLTRRGPVVIWKDQQARGFLIVIAVCVLLVGAFMVFSDQFTEGEALRLAAFNVTSIITGTGYATADYGLWGPAMLVVFLVFMFMGGCAGSTSCSAKIFRYQVAIAAFRSYLRTMLRPHIVAPPRYNGKALSPQAVHSVLTFLYVFLLCFAALAFVLSLMGLDPITAISGAATALCNVGPGLGPIIGPNGTFEPLHDPAKWALSIGMYVGRLEVLTALVLLSPRFWRS